MNLESLFLNDNEIQRLPSSLHCWSSLPALREIRLQYNRISVLPAQMAHLPSLQVLVEDGGWRMGVFNMMGMTGSLILRLGAGGAGGAPLCTEKPV